MPQAPFHRDSVAEFEEAVPLLFECMLTSRGSGAGWLHVAGELDMATAPRVEKALRQAERRARLVVLDLRGLTFMDCSGIHVIVDASLRARSRGHRLMLVRGPSQVDRVFALAGVLGVVDIVGLDTAEDAIQTHFGTAREGRCRDLTPYARGRVHERPRGQPLRRGRIDRAGPGKRRPEHVMSVVAATPADAASSSNGADPSVAETSGDD